MNGWAFYDDQAGTLCTATAMCDMVGGPGSPPLGAGSAELSVTATSAGRALILARYQGTRLDHITALHYLTYRQTSDAGNNLAIALQFNVDYDLTDASTGYQGRIVYEPYQSAGGTVTQNTWQHWDAKVGKWWGTKTTVQRAGLTVPNPCVQGTPCTWSQLLSTFPDLGIHSVYGAVVLKAGSGWSNFRGNVDSLVIGVDSANTIYDFEEHATLTRFALHTDFDGVAGTPFPTDTTYTAGAVIHYDLSASAGHEGLVVVVDDTIAPANGTVVMDTPHAIYAAADTILVATPDVQDMSARLMAVLNAADKPAAYSDFLQWYLDRSAVIGSEQLANQLRVASYLSIDAVRDHDLLASFYSAMAGHLDVIDNYSGSPSTYYFSPEDFGEPGAHARRAPIVRRLVPRAGSHFSRLSPQVQAGLPALGSAAGASLRATASIVTGPPWPQEPIMFTYVNGIHTARLDAVDTKARMQALIYQMARFAGPNPTAETSFYWNRDATGQMLAYSGVNECIGTFEDEFVVKAMLTSLVRYAQCKGTLFKRSVVNNDLLESLEQFIQLRYNRGIHVEDARELATIDSTYHWWGYHTIHLSHSQGNMLVAQALQELPAREGHALQRGMCTAQLTMASPIPRANIPLDQYHLKGFTIRNDILLQLGLPNDFPRYETDTSLALDSALAKVSADDRVKTLMKFGTRIHDVNYSYFTYPANKDHISKMLDTLSDECTAGSITTAPSELTVPYNGHVKVGVTVLNRNDRILLDRLFAGGGVHWSIGSDSIVVGFSPTTAGAEVAPITSYGQPLGQMSVTVGPAHFLGTIVEHRETAWRFSIGFSDTTADSVPPPTGTPGWDGTPSGCNQSITMAGSGGSWATWVAACTRYYTLEVPAGSMPGGTRLNLMYADYPDGELHSSGAPSTVPPEGIAGAEIGSYRCGPGYCLREAVIQTVTAAEVITSDTLCFSDNCAGSTRRSRVGLDQGVEKTLPFPLASGNTKPIPVLRRPPK
jgi:hypothetical protein